MQIGDATLIATAVGAPVVSDFRHADMAVGDRGRRWCRGRTTCFFAMRRRAG
ncbi:MAG: anhydro-N-acetylmuramic acid kinase [Planctomycetes bacterium]|nr:anhydro-N-acetylmuramic acid kinase [Planctomycetota bacterium]